MSLIPTWPIAAGALIIGLGAGFSVEHWRLGAELARVESQHAEQERTRQVQRAADERIARKKEQDLNKAAADALQGKQDEINAIAIRLAGTTSRLQQRPDRKSPDPGGMPGATPSCAGTTGAELSRPDGEFLAGEAARADTIRAALAQCYRQYEALIPTAETKTAE